jgi:hypothetical protein
MNLRTASMIIPFLAAAGMLAETLTAEAPAPLSRAADPPAPTTQACCLPGNGGCHDVTRETCQEWGGIWVLGKSCLTTDDVKPCEEGKYDRG